MAITLEEVAQTIINLVREKEALQAQNKLLQAELDNVRLTDKQTVGTKD